MSEARKEEVREVLEEYMEVEGREIIRQEVDRETVDKEELVEEIADEVESRLR
ncbi:hypothetical protein [Halorubrum sp. CGM5_25_10-8B]|uniref:hypothetical protein n=1 Tax=Halorubrum sp. CGM5_25_10-8B TaxID=2518115 RepID=UPI00130ECB05|nr:hypothetical protein [Halorubrum sp. CGM5_25_10-8B]